MEESSKIGSLGKGCQARKHTLLKESREGEEEGPHDARGAKQ